MVSVSYDERVVEPSKILAIHPILPNDAEFVPNSRAAKFGTAEFDNENTKVVVEDS